MEQLKAWLTSSGTRQAALAARLEINRGYMSQLVSGRKQPGLALAFRIERATGGAVPASCWLDAVDAEPPTPDEKDAA